MILYVPKNDGEIEERILLEPQRCKIDDGEIEGDYELEDLSDENDTSSNADSEMLLELKFSNKHSFLKTTKVNYEITISADDDDD